jgi:glycosyltransferase involved in cell wall biosynthesis
MVIGRDRPVGAAVPSTERRGWITEGALSTRYVKVGRSSGAGLREILRTTHHDLLVLNGFFDREFTIPALVLRRLGLIPRRPTILSPRGEFSAGALELKRARKRAYLTAVAKLGLIDDVWLHATGEDEAKEIRSACPWARRIAVAPNIRVLRPLPATGRSDSANGRLRLVFLSRIDRMKNLDYALQVLARISVPAVLDIYGPISDAAYWNECERMITSLPERVEARYRGAIPNEAVCATLAGYDLFLLPTKGENFGHAIFDGLEAGVPVLISDQTPWRDLGDAGYALPLAQPAVFQIAIEQFARLSPAERAAMRRAARSTAENAAKANDAVARSRSMLLAALQEGKCHRPAV